MRSGLTAGGGMILGMLVGIIFFDQPGPGMVFGLIFGGLVAARRRARAARSG